MTIGQGWKRRGGSGVRGPRETEFTRVRKLKDERILERGLATSTSDCCRQTYSGKSWGVRHGRVTAEEILWLLGRPAGIETVRGDTQRW